MKTKRIIRSILTLYLLGCFSPAVLFCKEYKKQLQTTVNQATETQIEKFQRLLVEKNNMLVTGSDKKATVESIESVLQPKEIISIKEIDDSSLMDPGTPYYFKLNALYKGYDKNAQKAILQPLNNDLNSVTGAALTQAFGIDTKNFLWMSLMTLLPLLFRLIQILLLHFIF